MLWMIAGSALLNLLSSPRAKPSTRRIFNHSSTFVIARRKPLWQLKGWHIQYVLDATSIPALQKMLRYRVPNCVRFVLYDPEHWRFTPESEQRHPGRSTRTAARLAHAQGLQLIAAPATDLIQSQEPARLWRGHVYQEYIKSGIAARVARWADWYEIQAQGAENNIRLYHHFIVAVRHQVILANPKAIILAGLSTNPDGHKTAASILYRDIRHTRRLVGGYWLNIPQGGPYCPRCGEARPTVAIGLLHRLYH